MTTAPSQWVREVHFVDAADGGYAFAARQLKQQLAQARAEKDHDPSIPPVDLGTPD